MSSCSARNPRQHKKIDILNAKKKKFACIAQNKYKRIYKCLKFLFEFNSRQTKQPREILGFDYKFKFRYSVESFDIRSEAKIF